MSRKVCLITDTHYGVRNDNVAFLEANKRFLDQVFFPTLDDRKINEVYHLGDLVDRRKSINTYTAHRLMSDFLEPLHWRSIDLHVIAGNHDTYHKNTNEINSLFVLLRDYPSFHWYIEPTEVRNILLLPWICADNREHSLDVIKNSEARWCFGHLELAGYQMYRGVVNEHGDNKELFSGYERVFTGHFHHKSSAGNITYLGSHGQFTWSDYGDRRGFHIFDLETGDLEFIENPETMFVKLVYDEEGETVLYNEGSDLTGVRDKYVKVVVRAKKNHTKFDKMMKVLQEQQPLDIQIVDEAFNVDATEVIDATVNVEDTLTIFKQQISQMEAIDVPQKDVEQLIFNLYKKAKEVA